LALLPLLAFVALFLVAWLRLARPGEALPDWRDTFARATIAWGWLVLGITEGLSALRLLTQPWLAAAWAVATLLIALWIMSLWRGGGAIRLNRWRESKHFLHLGFIDWALVSGLAAIVILTGLVAWMAPPQGFDVLIYHMPRVAHWAQNLSVAPYATPQSLQIWAPPWPEFSVLQFYVLWGGDRLANLTQWFSMVGILLLVSRLAGLMGADRRGQILSAVFAGTIPLLANESSDAYTDVVAVYWIVCTAWVVVRARAGNSSGGDWLALAGVLGLDVLTKGVCLAYALPLALWFAWAELKRRDLRKWVTWGMGLACLVLIAGSATWLPNWKSLGSPFGSRDHLAGVPNEHFGFGYSVSNVVRNLSLFATTPFDRWNAAIQDMVVGLHRLIGLDPSDPSNTIGGQTYGLGFLWPGEGAAPIHLGLATLAAGAFLLSPREEAKRLRAGLALSALAGFVFFSAVFRWQPSLRFHLSLLVLMAPLVGLWLSRIRLGWVAPLSALLCFLVVVPAVVFDRVRPLIRLPPYVMAHSILTRPRLKMYFGPADPRYAIYRSAAGLVLSSGCTDIGLMIDSHDEEYLWWMVLRPSRNGLRLEHLLTAPGLERLQDPGFRPCAVICTVCDASREWVSGMGGREIGDGVWLYFPAGVGP
jgi:4-amino-4-deoxy-L-arabinose transferase-like glycosyltransferase